MNKFGLMDDEPLDDLPGGQAAAESSLSERLASFPPAARRQAIDLHAVDAAAAPHGFVSREPPPRMPASVPAAPAIMGYGGRRRRVIPTEPTRHLAIRLPESQYDRFVAYADDLKMTYHDALIRLLDEAGR